MYSICRAVAVMITSVVLVSGCGYTTQVRLPYDIKSIYVETVENKINIKDVYAYQPGLEMDITNAVIRRIATDGNLKVKKVDMADAVLKMDLTAFEQEGVRFNLLENVDEYRLFIVLDMKLVHRESGEVIWHEPNFSGDTEYFVSEIQTIAQKTATGEAIEDLAKKVVDRIVEDW